MKIRYLVRIKRRWYWMPGKSARAAGFQVQPLGAEDGPAFARAAELNAAWDAARSNKERPPTARPGTLQWLADQYRTSDWYTSISPRARLETDAHLAIILAPPHDQWMVSAIRRGHVRTLYDNRIEKAGRDHANRTMKWLRRLLNYAIELELIRVNPAARMGLRHNPGRETVWTREEVAAFVAKANELDLPHIGLAVLLGYDTSQRLGDVLRATWSDYDGEGLTTRQGKTGAKVWNVLEPGTRAVLDATARRGIQIVVGPRRNRKLNESVFGRYFRQVREASGVRPELRYHDLRRTAATEVSAGGGNVEPLTGHRPGSSAIRRYVMPSKDAARKAQAARNQNEKS